MIRLIGIGLPDLCIMAALLICYWILLKLSAKAFNHFEKKNNKRTKAKGYGRND